MEAGEACPEEAQAASAVADSFSQLWSDVMGMLVSVKMGEGVRVTVGSQETFSLGAPIERGFIVDAVVVALCERM